MTCINEKLLQKYIDGECTYKEQEKVKHHLAICPSCEKKCAEMEELAAGVKRALHSLTGESIIIPPFRKPEPLQRSKKLLLYSLPAACMLGIVLFIVHKNPEPTRKRITIVRNIPAEVDANRPASDQDFVIEIYDSKDQE
jgi:anti-sigma factor ChrR (cupin superfamily)